MCRLYYFIVLAFLYSDKKVVLALQVLLGAGTLAQDLFQATLVSGYCLQAQLLAALAVALRHRLLQHTLAPIDWMRVYYYFVSLIFYFIFLLTRVICS